MKIVFIIAGSFSALIVTCLIIGTVYMGIPSRASLPPGVPEPNMPATVANTLRINAGNDKRRKFAFGMEAGTTEAPATIKNPQYTTEGDQATTLVVTADGISMIDCVDFQKGTYGQSAASIGFTGLTCRNRISGGEWSLALSK